MDAIDRTPITGESMDAIMELLSNKKAQDQVSFTIRRNEERKEIAVICEEVQFPVISFHMFTDHIGYIHIHSFAGDMDKEFADALHALQDQGMKSLLIDLRNNGGGYVDAALKLAHFFKQEGVFMYAIDREHPQGKPMQFEDGADFKLPTALLINEHTASAAEMFAGFMQDNNLADIIGTRSYGKGVAQQLVPLISGGMLKVTYTEWLTPKQHVVNHAGIQPDTELNGELEPVIHALRTLGAKQTKLELYETGANLNDMPLPVVVPDVVEDGREYLPSRLLSELIGGTVGWDSELSEVRISTDKLSALFAAKQSSQAVLKDGMCLVELHEFQKQFPELNWQRDGHILTLIMRRD
ncbi:S41 family peptidase [Paenibacillus hexagrammi]|uniref:S41 family peptidase n=1 Tax=Paenibacillus hexagrammi TaxID=2908839 RepID=A0ABY3SLD9_9BACL|nr:S41 family peptidase [Paenibacillus sp. YPD9-1]UJF34215.1 S41 family peptidase [Paenibacillus sp. YPD9-1]